MLLISKQSVVKKEFPSELVKGCKESKNSIVRTLKPLENNSNGVGATQKLPTLFEVENPIAGTMYNTFDIRSFSMDPSDKGIINSYVSLTTSASQIKMSADIIQMQDETILAVLDPVQGDNLNYLELNDYFQLDPNLDTSDIAAMVYANWTNLDGSDEELSMLCELNLSDERLKYEHKRPSIADKGVIIGNPLNMTYEEAVKADSNSDHIVIALYRKPEDMTDVNYVCGFGAQPGKPYIGIPAKGIFTMPSNYVPYVTGSYAPTATCIIGPRTGGGKTVANIIPEYSTDCKGMVFSAAGSQLIYDMACSWGEVYNEPAGWQKTEFDYELKLKITFENINDGTNKTYNARISSAASNQGAVEIIPPLYLMYGCLAADTKITMADGILKKICEVKIGEKVLGIDEDMWTVSNVWRGKENKPMIKIVANDRMLLLTENHPIVTIDGVKTAGNLQEGMEVLTSYGEYTELTQVEMVPYEGEVFNLDLKRGEEEEPNKHLMIADGFVVGDNILQNHMEDIVWVQ